MITWPMSAIPSKFLDPLTHEFQITPVILPCCQNRIDVLALQVWRIDHHKCPHCEKKIVFDASLIDEKKLKAVKKFVRKNPELFHGKDFDSLKAELDEPFQNEIDNAKDRVRIAFAVALGLGFLGLLPDNNHSCLFLYPAFSAICGLVLDKLKSTDNALIGFSWGLFVASALLVHNVAKERLQTHEKEPGTIALFYDKFYPVIHSLTSGIGYKIGKVVTECLASERLTEGFHTLAMSSFGVSSLAHLLYQYTGNSMFSESDYDYLRSLNYLTTVSYALIVTFHHTKYVANRFFPGKKQ